MQVCGGEDVGDLPGGLLCPGCPVSQRLHGTRSHQGYEHIQLPSNIENQCNTLVTLVLNTWPCFNTQDYNTMNGPYLERLQTQVSNIASNELWISSSYAPGQDKSEEYFIVSSSGIITWHIIPSGVRVLQAVSKSASSDIWACPPSMSNRSAYQVDIGIRCSSIRHTSRWTSPLVMSEEADFQNGL